MSTELIEKLATGYVRAYKIVIFTEDGPAYLNRWVPVINRIAVQGVDGASDYKTRNLALAAGRWVRENCRAMINE